MAAGLHAIGAGRCWQEFLAAAVEGWGKGIDGWREGGNKSEREREGERETEQSRRREARKGKLRGLTVQFAQQQCGNVRLRRGAASLPPSLSPSFSRFPRTLSLAMSRRLNLSGDAGTYLGEWDADERNGKGSWTSAPSSPPSRSLASLHVLGRWASWPRLGLRVEGEGFCDDAMVACTGLSGPPPGRVCRGGL